MINPSQALETGAKGERSMMQQYRSNSYLFGGNAPYVEELYEAYLLNPGSVPDNWRTYFDNLQHVPAVCLEETRVVAAQRVRARDLWEYQPRGGLQVEHQPLELHL